MATEDIPFIGDFPSYKLPFEGVPSYKPSIFIGGVLLARLITGGYTVFLGSNFTRMEWQGGFGTAQVGI